MVGYGYAECQDSDETREKFSRIGFGCLTQECVCAGGLSDGFEAEPFVGIGRGLGYGGLKCKGGIACQRMSWLWIRENCSGDGLRIQAITIGGEFALLGQ